MKAGLYVLGIRSYSTCGNDYILLLVPFQLIQGKFKKSFYFAVTTKSARQDKLDRDASNAQFYQGDYLRAPLVCMYGALFSFVCVCVCEIQICLSSQMCNSQDGFH
ncbi:hypothetical protein ABZP36_004832 [Zizania latifolia]